jgi:hypothetical protein
LLTPARVWLVIAIVYASFFGWYTSFGGALSPDEVEHYLGVMAANGGDPDRLALWREFMQSDTGDDFAMVNIIDMRDTPLQVDGVTPGESSSEVLARYTTPFMKAAVLSAAHPVYMGSAAADSLDLWGIEGAERWTTGALVRYRSRRDLMKQATKVGPTGIHEFKIAAMAKTIAFPVDPWFQLGDPRFVLALVLAVLGLGFHLRAALARARAL